MPGGWIDRANGSETAAELKARLDSDFDLPIYISKQSGSCIAYAGGGLMLRQKETELVWEYRGLTTAAADKLTELSSDATATTVYYKKFNNNSDDYAVAGVTTGVKTVVAAVRSNNADGFTARFTQTTYEADATSGWSTTRPSVSGTGVEVSRSSSTSFVDQITYNNDTFPVFATNLTVVTEYRYRTLAEARTLVSNNTSNTANNKTWKIVKGGITHYASIPTGTIKNATMRQVSPDEGWTVTVTTQTLSASGTDWSEA